MSRCKGMHHRSHDRRGGGVCQNPPVGRPPPGYRPPPLLRDNWDTTGYGQQAGGTHPTGMDAC